MHSVFVFLLATRLLGGSCIICENQFEEHVRSHDTFLLSCLQFTRLGSDNEKRLDSDNDDEKQEIKLLWPYTQSHTKTKQLLHNNYITLHNKYSTLHNTNSLRTQESHSQAT